jgi:hypothetical protein
MHLELTKEEAQWLHRLCQRALLFAEMNVFSSPQDPEKIKELIKKLESK